MSRWQVCCARGSWVCGRWHRSGSKNETNNSLWSGNRCVLRVLTDIGFPISVSFSERRTRPLKAGFRYEVCNLRCISPGFPCTPACLTLFNSAAVGRLLPSHLCESCHPLGQRASKINRNLALWPEETPFPVSVKGKVGRSTLVTTIVFWLLLAALSSFDPIPTFSVYLERGQ